MKYSKIAKIIFLTKNSFTFTLTFLKFDKMKKTYFLIISLLFAFQIIAPSRLYAQCTAPTALTISGLTQNSVVIAWQTSNVAGSYNVQYQTPNNPNWVVMSNVTSPLTLTGLNCGGVYVAQVQQVCLQTGTTTPLLSEWSNITFTTPGCTNVCTAPAGLTATNISQNGAVLNWTGTPSATALYNIRYHSGSTTWTTLNNVTMPYQLGNLPCGTGFEWQVQQICSTTPGTFSGVSPWSTGGTFSTLACSNPCLTPTGSATTNITQTSAVLNWNPNIIATPSIYNIRYHAANSTTWTVVNNVSAPYQLGNLPCGTGYIWQVQQVCSTANEPSPWSTGTTFSTSACPIVCEAPNGLTATSINQTSAVLNWNPNSTTTSLYNLQYHSATSTAWIAVNNITMPYTLANLSCGTGYAWQVQRICTNNPSGTTPTLSPWTTSTFSTPACTVVCEAPSGLTTTNITQTSAVLNWNPNSTSTSLYNLQYHSATSTAWITLSNVTMPYQLGNLTCGTGYAWRVQRVCSNAAGTSPTLSDWTTITFSTSPCPIVCLAPIELHSTNITQNGAVLHWGLATTTGVYNIRYHSANSTAWITLTNVSMPYQLGNLPCGTGFEWQVQQICLTTIPPTNTSFSPWSASATFSTLACPNPCVAPLELHSTSISQNGAVLHWGLATTTGVYNIRYHSANSTVWITLTNVSMPYQLGNLPCGTTFEWQVQQICGPASGTFSPLSPWSVGVAFSTLACPNPCVAPLELHSTNISQNGAVLHWGLATTTGVYNIRYHSANSTAWITLTNVSMPFQLGNLHCGMGYVWQVQQICNTTPGTISGLSPWSVGATFSTLICPNPNPCAAPTELTVADLTQTSAVLHWGVVPGAVAYIVSYKPLNTTITFTTVTTNTNTITVTGLTPSTSYTYQVRAICASGTTASSLSPLSAPYVFATPAALVIYPNPANDVLRMSYLINQGSAVTIQLRDSFGQVVSSVNEIAVEGLNEFKVDTIGISEGIYFLTVTTNSDTKTSKVFIKH